MDRKSKKKKKKQREEAESGRKVTGEDESSGEPDPHDRFKRLKDRCLYYSFFLFLFYLPTSFQM